MEVERIPRRVEGARRIYLRVPVHEQVLWTQAAAAQGTELSVWIRRAVHRALLDRFNLPAVSRGRGEALQIRVTGSEYRLWKTHAESSGWTINHWVRLAVNSTLSSYKM